MREREEAGTTIPVSRAGRPFGSASDLLAAISRRRGLQSRRCDRQDGSPAGGRRSPAWLGAEASAGQGSLARRARPRRCRWRARCRGESLVAVSEKLAPGSARLSPSDAPMCWGGGLVERHGRSVAECVMGRGRSSGNRGRGRGSRRFVARVGSRRRALVDRRVGGMRLAVAAFGRARSVAKIARFLWGRFARQARCVGLPPRLCASLSLADRARNGRRQFFSADAGALFSCPAQAPASFLRPGHLCIAKQKNWRLAVLRFATALRRRPMGAGCGCRPAL